MKLYAVIRLAGFEDVLAEYVGMTQEIITALLEAEGKTPIFIDQNEYGKLLALSAIKSKEFWVARKIYEVKIEAQRRILTRLPGATPENFRDKELNYIARRDELEAIETGRYRDETGTLQPARALTSAELAEIKTFVTFWNWVKANRAASNLIEAGIAASDNPASFDVVGSAWWPT